MHDLDGDGKLERAEVRKMLRNLSSGIEPTEEALDKVMSEAGGDEGICRENLARAIKKCAARGRARARHAPRVGRLTARSARRPLARRPRARGGTVSSRLARVSTPTLPRARRAKLTPGASPDTPRLVCSPPPLCARGALTKPRPPQV